MYYIDQVIKLMREKKWDTIQLSSSKQVSQLNMAMIAWIMNQKNQKTKKERINTHIPRLGGLWSESTFFEDFFKLHFM